MDKCVYLHKKPDGEVFYVGMGDSDRPYDYGNRSTWWKRVVKKHGAPIVEVICDGLSLEDAYEWEVLHIGFYGRKDRGRGTLINCSDGGSGGNTMGGRKHTATARKNMRAAQKKYFETHTGHNKGVPMSEEQKDKLRLCKRTVETKNKIRIKNTGKKRTQEQKDYIRLKTIEAMSNLSDDIKKNIKKGQFKKKNI